MVVNIVCELEKIGFGDNVWVVGVGQFSYSGDGEYSDSVDQMKVLDEIDVICGVVENNLFLGGFYVVLIEYSWQCFIVYIMIGVKEVCQLFKQMVINWFVVDLFMWWVVFDNVLYFICMIKWCGGKFNMFGIVKFSYFGV